MEKKEFYTYKLVDDYEWDEKVEDFIFHTNKDAKELLKFAIDEVWCSRDYEEELAKYDFDEDERTIKYNGEEYNIPENYDELINFIFELLENNGIEIWRPQIEVDETFYY